MRLEVSGFAAALAAERGCIPYEDGLAIPLRRKRSPITDWTLVSIEDRPLAEFNWSLNRQGYVRRRDKHDRSTTMAREVLGLEAGDKRVADHQNRVRTDNRRENLRVCTQGQNCQNQSVKRGSSQYRGVSARGDKWQAYGTLNGRMKGLGTFDTEEEAAEVAAAWRRLHMPYSND